MSRAFVGQTTSKGRSSGVSYRVHEGRTEPRLSFVGGEFGCLEVEVLLEGVGVGAG